MLEAGPNRPRVGQARDRNSEMVLAPLRHDQIDPKLKNRWFQAPLSLDTKGAHLLMLKRW